MRSWLQQRVLGPERGISEDAVTRCRSESCSAPSLDEVADGVPFIELQGNRRSDIFGGHKN